MLLCIMYNILYYNFIFIDQNMKNLKTILISSLLLSSMVLLWCQSPLPRNNNEIPSPQENTPKVIVDEIIIDKSDIINSHELLETIAQTKLSDIEKNSLIHMRQEEMLARDIYKVLYSKRWQNIFNNIWSSEQTHMDTIKYLLDRYNITDPIDENIPGIYESEELQSLYNQLTTQGSISLIEGLKVWATVEDLDIKDLEDFMSQTDNEDILLAYQNLTKGSRNHIRSFIRNIERQWWTYMAQFLTQEELNLILNNEQEKYMVDGKWKNMGNWGHK